jgi:hypothetical protein
MKIQVLHPNYVYFRTNFIKTFGLDVMKKLEDNNKSFNIGHLPLILRDKNNYRSAISLAFYWDQSPEGYEFWNEIHNKWYEECKYL